MIAPQRIQLRHLEPWQAARPDLERILAETRALCRALRAQARAFRTLHVVADGTGAPAGAPVVFSIACTAEPARRLTVTVDLDEVQLLKQWRSERYRSHDEPVPVAAYPSVDPAAWIGHLLAWVDDASAPPEEVEPA